VAQQVGQQHRQRRRWRKWQRALWCGLLPLTLFLLPPQVSRFTIGEPPVRPQPQLADAVNGWVALRPLLNVDQGRVPSGMYAPEPTPETIAATRAWVAQNVGLVRKLDTVFEKSAWSWPRPASPDTPMTELSALRQVIRLQCAAALVDAWDGRTEQASRRLDHVLRATDELQGCGASLIQLLVTVASEAILTRTIQCVAMAAPIEGDWAAWSPLVARLEAAPDRVQALAGAFDAEDELFSASLRSGGGPRCPNWWFDPWRTRASYREALDRVVTELARPRPERDWAWIDEVTAPPTGFSYNGAGRTITAMLVPTMRKVGDKADQVDAHRRLTLTTIALRRAFDRDGKLPASLATLVQTGLLAAVPIDPFDGRSLRYDATRRLLWSIGRNEVDDHGLGRKAGRETDDDVVPLVFR